MIVVKDLVRDAGAIDAAKDLDVRAACQWDGTRCSWIGYRWGGGVGVKSGKIVPKLDGGWKDGLGQFDRGRLRARCRGPESQRLVVRMGVKLALPGQLEYCRLGDR